MQLELIRQPESEIISVKETKDYLHISHDFDDELIKFLIRTNHEAIETIIQKSIIKQTWKYVIYREEFSNSATDGCPCILGSVIKIPMPRPPVLEILKISVDGMEVDRRKVKLEKINSTSYVYINNLKNFENSTQLSIEYDAGIALTPSQVPYQIKLANLMLVANSYQDRYQSCNKISSGVKELLSPFLNLRIF